MVWGGTILANSNALVPTPFPKFMHGEWPDLLKRIGETGVYDNWTCQDEAVDQEWKNEMSGLERGPNHVRSLSLFRNQIDQFFSY